MKKIIYTLFFLLIVTSSASAQTYEWRDISDRIPGETPNLGPYNIHFISADTGWIGVLGPPEILHTTDGGQTFVSQDNEYATNIHAVYMLNANEGYAGGSSGIVYRTTNSGTDWNYHGSIGATLADITFPSGSDTGYCCGDWGNIYQITSSGISQMTSNAGTVSLASISFPSTTEGWCCGENAIRHYTGGTWNADQSYPSGGYNSIHFLSGTIEGWCVGDQGRILHTTDGMSWQGQTNPDTAQRTLHDVFFLNANEGWAVGNQGRLLQTTDGGANWVVQEIMTTTNIFSCVFFTSSTNGYLGGNFRILFKYGLPLDVQEIETDILPDNFTLAQNYPNPFNPTTTIEFSVPTKSHVTLTVYNVLGQTVTTLVDHTLSAGNYKTDWIATENTGGVYFYKLETDDLNISKKMVLVK